MKNTYYTFREAKNEQELRQLLQLRYRNYRNSNLKGFCPENEDEIDLDVFDLYASHLGLFEVKFDACKPIGYMRIVHNEKSQLYNQVLYISETCSSQKNKSFYNIKEVPFPCMSYFPNSNVIMNLKGEVKNYCEGSRFVMENKVQNYKLSKFMFECAMAYTFYTKQFDGAIICCSEKHSCFYKRYGFGQMSGTSTANGIASKYSSSALLLLLEKEIPIKFQIKILGMSTTLSNFGAINYCPKRSVYYQPYKLVQLQIRSGKLVIAA